MDKVLKIVEQFAAAIIFCMAALILLVAYRETDKTIGTLKESVSKQNTIYEQQIDDVKIETVKYQEVISYLLGDLDYDLQINQIEIDKGTYEYKSFDLSRVPKGEYRKIYNYDSSGNIVKIVYMQ